MITIPIVLSTDENYAPYCATTITSILANSKKGDKLNFYILNTNLSSETKNKFKELKKIKNCSIDFLTINENHFNNCPISHHFSIETYFRFKLTSLFPNIDKLIYLDCDMVVLKDVADIFNINIEDYYAGMVTDTVIKHNLNTECARLGLSSNSYYFNAGLMVVNLKKWRNERIEEKFFKWVKKNRKKIKYVDQDVLNVVLNGFIKKLPEKYNVQLTYYKRRKKLLNLINDIYIVHYCGPEKPWSKKEMYLSEYFWKYAKLNPFYNQIREKFALHYSEMQESEIEFIKKLIKREQPKKILEIGIAAGSNLTVLLNETKDKNNVEIFGIDYNKKYYRNNLKESGWVVKELYPELVHKLSILTGGVTACFVDDIGNNIDFCILDTKHVLPGELLDFLMVLPYLKEGATCILHDTNLQNLPVQKGGICVSKNTSNSNLQYLNNSYATGILMSILASEKIFPKRYLKDFVLPNITTFKITSELKKYIQNVFYALALPWQYKLSDKDRKIIGSFIKKHYSEDNAEYFYKITDLMNKRIDAKNNFQGSNKKTNRDKKNNKNLKTNTKNISIFNQNHLEKINWAIHNPLKLIKKYAALGPTKIGIQKNSNTFNNIKHEKNKQYKNKTTELPNVSNIKFKFIDSSKTWYGVEKQFEKFLIGMGCEPSNDGTSICYAVDIGEINPYTLEKISPKNRTTLSKALNSKAEYVFYSQKSCKKWFKRKKNAYYLPSGADTNIFKIYPEISRDIDVGFVGKKYSTPTRRKFFNKLLLESKKGLFKFVMPQENKLYFENLAKFYNRCKIVVNDSQQNEINMRTFEATACGSLLITRKVPYLEELFELGKEVVVYYDFNDMIDKISYYLNNETVRNKIAKKGMRRTRLFHSYYNRAKFICNKISKERNKN